MQAATDEGPITAINVTPLVDIILVVLIIFMATAPIIQKRAVNVDVPKSSHHETSATEATRVEVNARRELFLGGRLVTPGQLGSSLSRASTGKPGLRVTLAADKSLSYADVVGVLDLIRESGIRKVGLEVSRK